MAYTVKIYYHHTDCGGVVYYATYLHFLEEARTEFLEQKGIRIAQLLKTGCLFVVSRQEIDYKAGAHYGDILEISTAVTSVSGVRINLEHRINLQGGALVAQARTTLAYIGKDFRPRPIPQEISQKLA